MQSNNESLNESAMTTTNMIARQQQPSQQQINRSGLSPRQLSLRAQNSVVHQNDESMIDLDPSRLETTISYAKMKDSVYSLHPHRGDGDKFTCGDVCCSITAGNHYCCSSSEHSDLEPFGIGIVLYFKFLKRMMWFLFLFILISLAPMALFFLRYYNIPSAEVNYYNVLTATTLGSLGLTSTSSNLGKHPAGASVSNDTFVYLECPEGTLTTYTNVFFGLAGAGQSANLIMKSEVDTSCNYPTGVESGYSSQCEGFQSCILNITYGMFLNTSSCTPKYTSMNVYFSTRCNNGDMTIYNIKVPKSLFSYIVVGCDGAIIILYLLMVYTLKSSSRSAIRNVLKNAYSGSQFSVLIKNLPTDVAPDLLRRQLWAHFENVLNHPIHRNHRVLDIHFIFPHRLLELRSKKGEYMKKKIELGRQFVELYCPEYQGINITIEQIAGHLNQIREGGDKKLLRNAEKLFNKINTLIERKADVDREIADIESSAQTEITGAFVTFNNMGAQQKCMEIFNTSPIERCCICLAGQKDLYINGILLQAFPADDPDNILWQNLGTPKLEICIRRGISYLLTVVLFVVTIAILVAPTFYQNEFLQKYPQTNCNDKDPTQTEAASDAAAGELGVGLLACYCKEDLTERLLEEFPTASNQQLCLDWFQAQVISTAVSFGVVAAVIVANKLVDAVFQVLSTFEKHDSTTERVSSRTIKSFIAQFINTGLIYLLVNARLSNLSFWEGKYTDTVPVWYKNVGAVLLSTMIVNMAALPLGNLIGCMCKGIARCWDRGCSTDETKTRKRFQKDYVALYSGPKFFVDRRYSTVLNVIFVCFLYSSSIPLLYTVAFVQIMIIFYLDKYLLLKHAKKPDPYDEKLDLVIQSVMYYIIVVHLIFAIWMYGNADYFDQSYLDLGGSLTSVQSLVDNINSASYGPITQWSQRAVQSYNYIMLVILIIVLALFFVKGFLVSFCKRTLCTLCVKTSSTSARIAPTQDLEGGDNEFRDPQNSVSFFDVISAADIATLYKLTKYTLDVDSSTPEYKDLLARKLMMLKKFYEYKLRMEAEGKVDPNINFIGMFTYDLRLSPMFKDQFGIEQLLEKIQI